MCWLVKTFCWQKLLWIKITVQTINNYVKALNKFNVTLLAYRLEGPFNPYSALLVTSHCVLHRNDSLHVLACGLCVRRKGGTGGGAWGHPQGDMQMVAARLGYEKVMVGTGWATSRPECMDRLTKHHPHLVGVWFLARKAALGSELVYEYWECWLLHE